MKGEKRNIRNERATKGVSGVDVHRDHREVSLRSAGISDASRQIIDEYQPHVIRADNAANE